MTEAQTPSERITAGATSWPGVEATPGNRGELAFTVGRRQIGHDPIVERHGLPQSSPT